MSILTDMRGNLHVDTRYDAHKMCIVSIHICGGVLINYCASTFVCNQLTYVLVTAQVKLISSTIYLVTGLPFFCFCFPAGKPDKYALALYSSYAQACDLNDPVESSSHVQLNLRYITTGLYLIKL